MTLKLLSPNQYSQVTGHLSKIGFNTIFASTVVQRSIPGRIFVDDLKNPSSFFIAHPYGMSLLLGSAENEEFNKSLCHFILDSQARKRPEWLQIHPLSWKPVLEEMLGEHLVRKMVDIKNPAIAPAEPGKVMEYTRVNFRFDRARYAAFRAQMAPKNYEIIRTDEKIFTAMQGTVIPKYFWRDAGHFLKDGVGFTLMRNGEPASTAFCAFMQKNRLEIGIETMEKYRGTGLSPYVCAALIDYALEKGCEPIWSCRLENLGSYRLAHKLGFEPTHYLPYYLLPSSP